MLQIKTHIGKAAHCTIILSAGNDSARLNAYLFYLSEARLAPGYELIVVNDQGLEIGREQSGLYLPAMKVLNVSDRLSQEQLFDRGAMEAKGKFLLFVRGFVKFDQMLLEESIKGLENSDEKISISVDKNLILAENPFHPSKDDLGGNGERVDIFYKNKIRFDELSVNQKSHYKRYEFAKSIIPPGKIVGDFACGTAYGSVMLSEKSNHVIGADINEKVIEQVKVRYEKVCNIEFVNANLLDLKYESLFDYIVSFETVEHLKEYDVPKLFRVFSRALKPGGTIIFSTPYMQEMSPVAINMGFHLTFYIDEAKIQRWLSTNSLACEYIKYQNHQTHNLEDHLGNKDFIICVARSCKNAIFNAREHFEPETALGIRDFGLLKG
jgi:2-polyprenyl-3-methyl-5-hydroxy-6-metoxy-1,4-benzoquinol methylase